MAEINLLPQEERTAENFEFLVKRLTTMAVVLLAATAVFTLATLIFFTTLASQRANYFEQIRQNSQQVESLKAAEELIVVIKGKLATADKLTSNRTDFSKIFDKLSQLTPQGAYFTDIKFSQGKAIISGKAKTTADVSGLITQLMGQGSEIFANISVDSLNSDETGIYSFVISGQL